MFEIAGPIVDVETIASGRAIWECKRQKELQSSLSPKIAAIAWTAQQRLHRRYWALSNKSKPSAKIVTALARELAGFVWAIGVETEQALKTAAAA